MPTMTDPAMQALHLLGLYPVEETLERTPPEIRESLRFLSRRITQLETTDPQRHIEQLEGTIRGLHAEIEDLKATILQQQQQIRQLQQLLADSQAKLNTNSTNSSLPPSSDRFRVKRRPPPPADQPKKRRCGQPGHPQHQRPLVPPE